MFRQAFSVESAADMSNSANIGGMQGQDIILISDREFPVGTEYRLAVKPFKSSLRLNPGERVNDALYAGLLTVYEAGKAGESVHARFQGYRHRINTYIEEHCKKDSGALVASITTGQMTNMSEELREAFSVTGLAHILSISGTHFGLFSVFLFAIFGFLRKETALPDSPETFSLSVAVAGGSHPLPPVHARISRSVRGEYPGDTIIHYDNAFPFRSGHRQEGILACLASLCSLYSGRMGPGGILQSLFPAFIPCGPLHRIFDPGKR